MPFEHRRPSRPYRGNRNRPSASCTAKPSSSSENNALDRCAASGHTASSTARSTGDSDPRNTSNNFPRTCRSVPSNFCTRRFAAANSSSDGPGDPAATHAHDPRTGHSPHAGDVRHTVAPNSIHATDNSAAADGSS